MAEGLLDQRLPLAGGITNASYRVDVDGEAFVLRIWAGGTELLGIDRHREYRCSVAASRTGVAPEVVCFLPDDGLLVTRFVPGRALSPKEAVTSEVLARVVQAMHRYHEGPAFEDSFSPLPDDRGVPPRGPAVGRAAA